MNTCRRSVSFGRRAAGLVVFFLLSALCSSTGAFDRADGKVALLKTPDEGIQPQAVIDQRGALHLIYFKGDPAAGDLFYVRREPGRQTFTDPIQVNSQRGSAIAVGTIRGGQIAAGKGGRVHVAWNGSGKATPRGPDRSSPMLYARLNDEGIAFEPQRNLMESSRFLDGGGTVAADPEGTVYVAWHGLPVDAKPGEDRRRLYVARSRDEGKTFTPATPAWDKPTGACACCGARAFAERNGTVHLLYRSATELVHRDMYQLSSRDQGKTFGGVRLHPWEIGHCPMSSEAFAEGSEKVVAAWETDGQIYFTTIDRDTLEPRKPQAAPGSSGERKHPAVAVNDKGELLVAWTEGTGWQKGGSLAWQVFDPAGAPTRERGRVAGAVPVWGLPTAVAISGKGFLIIH